jgi:rod shape-determining protein MreC
MLFFQTKERKIKGLNRTLGVFLVLITLSFFLVMFSTRPFISNVKEFGFSVFSGFHSLVTGVQGYFKNTVQSIRVLGDLKDEYEELSQQLDRYANMEREFADIRLENKRLKELLGFSNSISVKHVPARITGKNPDNMYSALIVNKGTIHGIKKNMPVIAYNGGMQGLVGKVVQTGRFESMIMPLHDITSHVTARLSSSRYEGIISGQGSQDDELVMHYIKKRARDEINNGDVVITSGMGGVYPAGIPVGRVDSIAAHEYKSSLLLSLEPVVDFSRLEYVFILDTDEQDAGGNTHD